MATNDPSLPAPIRALMAYREAVEAHMETYQRAIATAQAQCQSVMEEAPVEQRNSWCIPSAPAIDWRDTQELTRRLADAVIAGATATWTTGGVSAVPKTLPPKLETMAIPDLWRLLEKRFGGPQAVHLSRQQAVDALDSTFWFQGQRPRVRELKHGLILRLYLPRHFMRVTFGYEAGNALAALAKALGSFAAWLVEERGDQADLTPAAVSAGFQKLKAAWIDQLVPMGDRQVVLEGRTGILMEATRRTEGADLKIHSALAADLNTFLQLHRRQEAA